MYHFIHSIFSLLLLFLLLIQPAAARQNQFSAAKAPAWVEEVSFDEKAKPTDAQQAGGSYLLLLDKQYAAGAETMFRRIAVKILNEKGLQEEADITVDYDPSYQQLSFHTLEIIRDGKKVNKLAVGDFKIIQREAEASMKLYDGRLTAINHLTDVRVGDIIEYSYTIKGRNPMYQGVFFDEFYWQYGVPVAKISFRLLLPEGRSITLREKGKVPPPTITRTAGQQIYSWQKELIPAIDYESQIPSWYEAAPYTQLSEFSDWSKVVELFVADYQAAQTIPEAQWKALSEELFTINDTQEDKITRLLHFVQNDIRYLGLENGISAYKPHAPGQVLQQKYGDCKDKALLLCALLEKIGVEAHPALVNTYQRGTIEEQLPNPSAFNHCIVRMNYRDSTYWFDATTNSQGGTFRTVSLPAYQKALVMRRGEKRLTTITDYSVDKREIKAYYSIKKGADEASELTIMSRYKGFEAEGQRSAFRNTSVREIEKNYLNYYAGVYPGISIRKDLDFRDRATEFETEENYSIKNLWETSTEGSGNLVAGFYPLYLNDMLAVPDKKLREMPFTLNYPLQVNEEIILEMPEDWGVEEEESEISNEFFTFTYKVNYRHPVITVQYGYELHKDHVPADKIAAYIKDIEQVKKYLGYQIYYTEEAQLAQQLSYPIAALCLLMLGVFVAASLVLYKRYNPQPLSVITSHTSIGGWMFLPLLGLIATPIINLREIISWDYFNAAVVHKLFESTSIFYNPLHGTILILELLFNLAITVTATMLLVLMLKRRSSFPRLMTLYLLGNFSFLFLEVLVIEYYQVVDSSLLTESYGQIAKALIGCLIWIPYFNLSERVKETFTVSYQVHAADREVQENFQPEVAVVSEAADEKQE